MKEEANKLIKNDLEVNIVQFHEDKHKRNSSTIAQLEKVENDLREENDLLKDEI